MAAGYTFTVEKECPICEEKINVTKTRSRLLKVNQDSDFCVYYKDFNPTYYTIWVCSHCGYAAEEKNFTQLREPDKKKIKEFLANKKVGIHYTETRTRDEAIVAFKLAIYFADLTSASASRMAGLYLKLAWLYREAKDEEKENELLSRALEYYEKSLITERYPIGPMTDITVTYLIGDLHRRTGNLDKATQYLSKVIGDSRARMEPAIYNLARDLWQEMRNLKAKNK